jgi:predicted ATPase
MGFAADDFGYLVDLGIPQSAGPSVFVRDPEIKREMLFAGPVLRPSATLVRRSRAFAEAVNADNGFDELSRALPLYRSVLAEYAHPHALPELAAVRDRLRGWRFYDGFRVDSAAPARQPQVGTRTPVLSDDGSDLAAAIQTILESGFDDLSRVVADAFDGATVSVAIHDGLFDLQLRQRGMLRPLRAAELSDGTLRFLLWAAALLSPDAPSLMVLNEPETSLHPDLVRPLTSLIRAAAAQTQVVVVTHSRSLLKFLDTVPVSEGSDGAVEIELYKDWGETRITGQNLLTTPRWDWGKR